MSEQNGALVPTVSQSTEVMGFGTAAGFELMQRVAGAFTSSDLVPENFRGPDKKGNAVIALELANRIGASPLMVMQNLNVIHGRPSFSSQFIISAINSCGSFGPLRFRVTGEGDDKTCTAYAVEKATGEVLEGPPVSIAMAKAEGWYGKNGSKWKTMPDLMLRYRSAAFFGRLYAPEILMGMQSADEAEDMIDVTPPAPQATSAASVINAELSHQADQKPAATRTRRTPAKVIDAEPEKATEPAGEPSATAEPPSPQTANNPSQAASEIENTEGPEQTEDGEKLWD